MGPILLAILRRSRQKPMTQASCWILLLCLLSGDIQTNPGPALRVFQQNINSLKGKLGVMRSLAGELSDYHAICLTETKLGQSIGDAELQMGLSDFTWFRKDRDENGGGVACGIRTALSPVRRMDMETECECLVIQESAFKRKKANPTDENVALHAQARTEFKLQAARSYRDYLLGLIRDFNENSKRFWTFVRSLKSCGRVSPVLELNGRVWHI
ncbi:hypothetical protein FJT64_007993 [Amphibalanus amphitrite]|uniref:Uncharacterized protein n=1 Tax=Amphibalanus amphitrite TaxID=1232801 RepID=A0A6A4VWS8_AMPAM|nr:hypothetical protein FJT64_007993 [Amphibalanus amphitrite]